MYDRILFPTDGSEAATAAFEYALEIAATHDATVYVLNVIDLPFDTPSRIRDELAETLEREGTEVVEETAARASEWNVSVVTEIREGVPHEAIVEYAGEEDMDLLVMPTHGRDGIERFLLGSVTERVVNTAPVPVLAVTPDEHEAFAYPCEDVLVPTDGSAGAGRALEEGIALSKALDARLHLLHVVEATSLGDESGPGKTDERVEDRANEILTEASETAERASVGSVTRSIAHGRPYREIRSFVEEAGIDVIALGVHGETDFSRYALGGVSAKLLRTSPVPLLMLRELDETE